MSNGGCSLELRRDETVLWPRQENQPSSLSSVLAYQLHHASKEQ